MAALYSHTTRADGLILTAAIYNADHQNHIDQGVPLQHDDYSVSVAQMQTKTDPGEVGTESQPTTTAGEFERLRFAIHELKRPFNNTAAQWYSTVGTPGTETVFNDDQSDIDFRVESDTLANAFFLDAALGKVFINDTTNVDVSGSSLTINQGANDDQILALKSSDVAHGITTQTETDTFGYADKAIAAEGGLKITGVTETDRGMILDGMVTTVDTTAATTTNACVEIRGRLKTGTTVTNPSANANLFAVKSNNDTRFMIDQEGDIRLDGNGGATALNGTVFDAYDDAQLCRAFDLQRAPDRVIRTEFDDFMSYNKGTLEDLGILGRVPEGSPEGTRGLVNITQLQRLHNGAIVQLDRKLRRIEQRLEALTAKNPRETIEFQP